MIGCSTTEHVSLLWRVWKLTIALWPIAPWMDALPQSMFRFFEGCENLPQPYDPLHHDWMLYHRACFASLKSENLPQPYDPLYQDWMLYHRACFASLKGVKTYHSLVELPISREFGWDIFYMIQQQSVRQEGLVTEIKDNAQYSVAWIKLNISFFWFNYVNFKLLRFGWELNSLK